MEFEWLKRVRTLCYRSLRRKFGIARMNLNSRTDCIMLTMLGRVRLTCCVLPQGKAINVRVMPINLRMRFEQFAFVLKVARNSFQHFPRSRF